MTIYCHLFHLLNTVLNLLDVHTYAVNILRGSHNIVNNIEHVQWALHEKLKSYYHNRSGFRDAIAHPLTI